MQLIVDGTIFEKNTFGGIARIFKNILPLICDLDPKLKIVMFFTKSPKLPYPQHKQISTVFLNDVQKLRPWRIWKPYHQNAKHFYLKWRLGSTTKSIWVSTYFTMPPEYWKGTQVVWIYDLIYELYPDILFNSATEIESKQKAILAADKVFCISKTTAQDLRIFYPIDEEKIVVAQLSCDKYFKKRSDPEIKNRISYNYFLFIGRRSGYKGFDTLLEAYSCWRYHHDHRLLVIGQDWTDKEFADIKRLGLVNDIVLIKSVDDEYLCDLYNQAEGLIYPSRYEGFGIPLLEAIACGCPVIASRIPSTEEVVGDVPFYFEPGDAEGLRSALGRVISTDDLQNRIEQGYQKATEYTWEKTAQAFYNGLKELNDNI